MTLPFKGMVRENKVSSGLSLPPNQESFHHCLSIVPRSWDWGPGCCICIYRDEMALVAKLQAVARVAARRGLCYSSATPCWLNVTLLGLCLSLGTAGISTRMGKISIQHSKERNGSAGSTGRVVPPRASVAHGSGLASLLLRGCE